MAIAEALIGGGLGIIGSLLGGSSAKKQARAQAEQNRQALEFQQGQYDVGKLNQLLAYLGPDGIKRLRAILPKETADKLLGRKAANPSFTADQQREYERLKAELAKGTLAAGRGSGGPKGFRENFITPEERRAYQAQLDSLVRAAGGDPGMAGQFDEDALAALGPGLVSRFGALADQDEEAGRENMRRFDADTFALTRKSRDIERGASQFGAQEEARIRRESEASLQNANAAAQSALMSRGMGASSAMTDAIRGNTRENQYATEDAVGRLKDRQIQLKTGLKQGTLGLEGARSSAASGMREANRGQNVNLRTGVLNMERDALTGNVMNPWLGQSALSYFQSPSASAAGMNVIGSSLTGLGSQLLGYGLGGGTLFGGREEKQQAPAAPNFGLGNLGMMNDYQTYLAR